MKATMQSVHANRAGSVWSSGRGADWRERAACSKEGVYVEAFFADKSEHQEIEYAKSICATCPVIYECGQVSAREPYGVWAGLTEWDRKPPSVTSPWPTKIPHGSNGGYDAHKLRGQTPCEPCRLAGNAYRADLKRRRAERAEVAS